MTAPAGPRRSPLGLVLAVALVLSGLIFMGQGLGILTAGRSVMIGDPKWAVIGAGCPRLAQPRPSLIAELCPCGPRAARAARATLWPPGPRGPRSPPGHR